MCQYDLLIGIRPQIYFTYSSKKYREATLFFRFWVGLEYVWILYFCISIPGQEVPHVILLISINDQTQSLLEGLLPPNAFAVAAEVSLVTKLATNNLLPEGRTDRNRKTGGLPAQYGQVTS